MKKLLLIVSILLFLPIVVVYGGDNEFNVFNAQELTGGNAYSLDAIESATYLDTGDAAMTATNNGNIYFHVYDETETGDESLPDIVIPNDNISGSGAWVLAFVYTETQAALGKRTVSLILNANNETLQTGEDFSNINFAIPDTLDGWVLSDVSAAVSTPSGSGDPTFQIHNETESADMLSTELTIDEGEEHSSTASTAAVVDTTNDTVSEGDFLRFDCDVSGTGTKGCQIDLIFIQE